MGIPVNLVGTHMGTVWVFVVSLVGSHWYWVSIAMNLGGIHMGTV